MTDDLALISHPHLPSIQRVVDLGVCTWTRKHTDGLPCGKIHNRCSGHIRASNPEREATRDNPCGQSPLPGLSVCRFHGGGQPKARAKGAERVQKQRALGAVGKLLAECRIQVAGRTEVEALDSLRDDAASMVLVIRMMLADLPERASADIAIHYDDKGAPHTIVTTHADGLIGPNSKGELSRHVLEQMLGEWIDRSARIEKTAADLGLAERRIALDEGKARQIIVVIRGTLAALGVDFDDARVPGIVAAQMRALEASGIESS